MISRIQGGVTTPRGFLANGCAAGIKRQGPDLGLIASERMAAVAGMLTTNRLAAAPVLLAKAILRSGQAQAIVANSGNANCCTGPQGLKDARAIQRETASLLGWVPGSVLVASTGVIGRRLPIRRILKALPNLVKGLDPRGSNRAAKAILTTDSVTKSIAVYTKIQGRVVSIGGIAKGSGMIDPHLATMLCFLTTDAAVSPGALTLALKQAADDSFNRITIDGQMSTNDMVILFANGLAGHRPLKPGENGWAAFTEALRMVTQHLARAIVRDGEGATRLFTVWVEGARSEPEAKRLAKAIANAPLIKTMVSGQDPNWGRVAATVGAAGIPVNPRSLEIALSGVPVFRRGAPVAVNRLALKERFQGPEVSMEVKLGRGRERASVLSCDLTEGYVRINAKYS